MLKRAVHRHKNQIRRQFPLELLTAEKKQEGAQLSPPNPSWSQEAGQCSFV